MESVHECGRPWAVALAGLLALMWPARGAADEARSEPRRQLGEHVFIPREAIGDPFTTSFVGSETGFGYGTGGGPTFDLDGRQVSLADYQVGAYSQIFTGQWGILEWWSVRLKGTGVVYSGINGSAAAGVGLNGVVRFGAGTTFTIAPLPTLRLGLLFDVGVGPSVGLDIIQAIRDSINSGSVETPVQSTASTTLTPALSVAWTITRGLGLLANVGYSHNTVTANAASIGTDTLGFAIGLDLDLRELGTIPLGLAFNYASGYSIGAQRFRQWQFGGGIFYTGRTELTLGLEMVYNRAPLGTHDVFLASTQGLIVLRYNFN